MSRKPLILVSPATQKKGAEFSDLSVNLSECYPRAVIAAGGLPVLLSCTPSAAYVEESVATADGVMLTGGEDIQPRLYAGSLPAALEATIPAVEPERDLFETMLISEVFRQRKPLMAICRGHQMLNVAFGGSLLVDIHTQRPQALAHRQMDRKNHPVHEIALTAGSLIARVLGQQVVRVNSTHHQAIDRLAAPLRVTATSPDGIIEATELKPGRQPLLPWFLSVQFHPERLCVNYPEFLSLFRAFVQACAAAPPAPV